MFLAEPSLALSDKTTAIRSRFCVSGVSDEGPTDKRHLPRLGPCFVTRRARYTAPMIDKMEQQPQVPRFDRFTPVRLKPNAPARSREMLPMADTTYIVYWRNEADEFKSEARLLISEPVDESVIETLKSAVSESDVQNVLAGAKRISYYVDESEVIVDVRYLNRKA